MTLTISPPNTPIGQQVDALLRAAMIDADGVRHSTTCPEIKGARKLDAFGFLRLAELAIRLGAKP